MPFENFDLCHHPYRYFEHLHFCHRHNFSKRLHFEHLFHDFSKWLHFEHLFHHFSKWLHRVHLATPRRISQNTCVSLTPRLGPRKAFSEKKIGIEISKTWGLSHPCSHSITAETISLYHTLTTWQSIRIFNLNINSFFHKHRPERSFELGVCGRNNLDLNALTTQHDNDDGGDYHHHHHHHH